MIPGRVARAVFVIDAKGILRYSDVRPIGLFKPKDDDNIASDSRAQKELGQGGPISRRLKWLKHQMHTLRREAPGACRFAPFPNELGQRIAAEICQPCWSGWLQKQTQIINHYGLDLTNP